MLTTACIGLLLVLLCAIAPPPTVAAAAEPCTRSLAVGSHVLTLDVGGVTRTAIVHLPDRLAPGTAVPLVLVLHGAGQQGALFETDTGFSSIADAKGFIAVYPDALPRSAAQQRPFWNINDTDPAQPDDVAFLRQLIDVVTAQGCVDATRVYATGMSNGASMTSRIGCELADRLAAIAPISGGYGSQPSCVPSRPVSVLEIHGTLDGTVPYHGKAGGFGAVRPYLDRWAGWDGCQPRPAGRLVAPRTLRLTWNGCARGTAVAHLRIEGGTHQVPGGAPPEPGPASPFSAPLLIWHFFASHRAAAPAS